MGIVALFREWRGSQESQQAGMIAFRGEKNLVLHER
jgi:hypothetical protein